MHPLLEKLPAKLQKKKIFIIGCGAVAQCSIALILKKQMLAAEQIVVIDPLDKRSAIENALQQGVRFIQEKITKDNYHTFLSNHLKPKDICIDLANLVDTYDILSWCINNDVGYLNTSLNHWPDAEKIPLYQQFDRMHSLAKQYPTSATAVLSHGANPGLISSFVKKGLIDYAEHRLAQKKEPLDAIEDALANNQFNKLAHALDIRAIHITEIDSQNENHGASKDTFINTWNTVEFMNEFFAPIEFAWGTHESDTPPHATIHNGSIRIPTPGLNSHAKSYIIDEEYSGFIITHDETHSIADFLTVKQNNETHYRPTTLFIYNPCPPAQNSLRTLSEKKALRLPHEQIITKEIRSGAEKVGCLLMSAHEGWWTGSILRIEESNRLLPGHNSTVLQVAAGVVAALKYIRENPDEGIRFPEQLDHTSILDTARPYLGTLVSQKTNLPFKNNTFNAYVIKI